MTNAIAKNNVALAVNRTGDLRHGSGIGKQRLELCLFAVAPGRASLPLAFGWFDGKVGNSVGLDPGNQVMALLEQAFDDLACGVVGIGDKVEWGPNGEDLEQCEHFVKQSAFVAIGPNQALMDPCGERHGEEALSRVHKQADGLEGMPHDVFRLSVGFRLLMQQLDSWHLLAALGNLDAVPDQDQPAVDTHRTWEQPQHRLRPQSRKPIELDASAVKMGEQPMVELGPQIERAHN